MSDFGDGYNRGQKELTYLIGLASIFTRGKVTAKQAVAVFDAAATVMEESKHESKHGGMVHALGKLYRDKDLPVALIEAALLPLLGDIFFREVIVKKLQKLAAWIEASGVEPGDQPYREFLAELCEAKQKVQVAHKRYDKSDLPDDTDNEEDE